MIQQKVKNEIISLLGITELALLRPFHSNHADFAFHIKGLSTYSSDDVPEIVKKLSTSHLFQEVKEVQGFINITVKDELLVEQATNLQRSFTKAVRESITPFRLIIDYGGANIAKPMHVGHLRSSILGDCLKRIARALGHTVIGDIHLGDWGTQMGMVISELRREQPELPYFDEQFPGEYPKDPPFTIEDLERLYPQASKRCKENEQDMEEARMITAELQNRKPGYYELWKHIRTVSVQALKKDYDLLGIDFDLWLGESDMQPHIPELIQQLTTQGQTEKSDGAIIIPLETNGKKTQPLLLVKSDGAYLYGTTDLATIQDRVKNHTPDAIWYVVDVRQSQHFNQLFLAAYKTGIVPKNLTLDHIYFGTINGKDGKPFKTRAGGVMKLNDLIVLVIHKAEARLKENNIAADYSQEEQKEIARKVAISTLKFGDLMHNRKSDYTFDIDELSSFEGKTGPYILYTAVRAKSIIKKAVEKNVVGSQIQIPLSNIERELLYVLTLLPSYVNRAFDTKQPIELCDYIYELAGLFNTFYAQHHILHESDSTLQAARLALIQLTADTLEWSLSLLGIETPERM